LLLLTRMKSQKPLVARSPLFPSPRILVLNPGAVSTQVAVFQGEETIFNTILEHENTSFEGCATLLDQLEPRMSFVHDLLEQHGLPLESMDLISARGGMLEGAEPGCYQVTQAMLSALKNEAAQAHSSNLGAFMAWQAGQGKKVALVSDCPTLDELTPINRLTGFKGIPRVPVWHALNQRQVARMYADSVN
jgi:butyrate kinase